MDLGFIATKMQAQVMKVREDLASRYDRYPDSMLFWCLLDLVDSSNYRLLRGPKEGYIRAETLFTLVRETVAPASDVRIIKETGDGALLCAPTFRNLFESFILVDQVAFQMAAIAGDAEFPFRVRGAMNFGIAKRLTRPTEDYVGIPIDQVSRLLSVNTDALLLHEDAYAQLKDVLPEYGSIVSVSEHPVQLPAGLSKGLVRPVYYRELRVDRARAHSFGEHFGPWKR